MAKIFISHSSRNVERARQIFDWLAANGWTDVFLDNDPERGIVAGQRWKEALQKAARRCEVVLALVSTEWLASGWCKAEVDAAKLMGKKVIVALIGVNVGDVPVDLTDEQWVDLDNDPRGLVRLKEGLKRAGIDPSNFPFEEGRRPYPGFAFLEEKDAAIFFGREAQIVRGLDKLRTMNRTGVDRVLVILGASGSGKSSFLRAGLLPRLKVDDQTWLPLACIRPERAVMSGKYGLAQVLQQKIAEAGFADEARKRGLPRSLAEIQEFIESEHEGLQRIFNLLREVGQVPSLSGETTQPPTIVLSVDQGEELFNEQGRGETRRFIEIISRAVESDLRVQVIIVIRSDSFPQLQIEPRLAELAKDTFTLDMMLEGSYRAVIEGPASLVKPTPLRVDPQLTDELLKDVSGQDALPLLAFTLAHLYERYAADNELTLRAYEKLGRLKGVIETAVSETFAEGVARGLLPKDPKAQLALARLAFIPHLVRINAARQFVRRVAARDEIPAEAMPLIDLFAERRLLIKDLRRIGGTDAEVVEVAHEALLRQAPLSSWLADDRDFIAWRDERLVPARTAFEANERGLLVGRELQISRDWVQKRPRSDLAAADREFIDQSIEADDKRREQEERAREQEQRRQLTTKYSRVAAIIGGTLALVAMLFGIYALDQKRIADLARHTAEQQRRIAEQARGAAEQSQVVAEQQRKDAEEQRKIAERLSEQNATLLGIVRLFVSATIPPNQEAQLEKEFQLCSVARSAMRASARSSAPRGISSGSCTVSNLDLASVHICTMAIR